jgi:hypothetical protein
VPRATHQGLRLTADTRLRGATVESYRTNAHTISVKEQSTSRATNTIAFNPYRVRRLSRKGSAVRVRSGGPGTSQVLAIDFHGQVLGTQTCTLRSENKRIYPCLNVRAPACVLREKLSVNKANTGGFSGGFSGLRERCEPYYKERLNRRGNRPCTCLPKNFEKI